jgi:hypothetical protein
VIDIRRARSQWSVSEHTYMRLPASSVTTSSRYTPREPHSSQACANCVRSKG